MNVRHSLRLVAAFQITCGLAGVAGVVQSWPLEDSAGMGSWGPLAGLSLLALAGITAGILLLRGQEALGSKLAYFFCGIQAPYLSTPALSYHLWIGSSLIVGARDGELGIFGHLGTEVHIGRDIGSWGAGLNVLAVGVILLLYRTRRREDLGAWLKSFKPNTSVSTEHK